MFFNSCEKDAVTKTPQDMLVGTWKITAVSVSPGLDLGNGTIITDMTPFMTCITDNVIIISAGGTYTQDEGGSKCDPNDSQSTTGSWVLSPDNKTLTMDGDVTTVEINTNSIQMSSKETTDGIEYTYTITFTKQ